MKRPGTTNIASDFVTAPKKIQSDGSGLGRLPDSVVTDKVSQEEETNPRNTNCADKEGAEGFSQEGPATATQEDDVAMGEVAADGSSVEAVRETQF